MRIIEPHLTDSYGLLRQETPAIRFRKNLLSYCIPFVFSGMTVVGIFLTERTLVFFIFVLIPVTILSLIAGITIANFLQSGQKRLMPGFTLFLEWKTGKGLIRDAGIREPIEYAFPGYICSVKTTGVEYAYTCITASNVYVIWCASRTRQMYTLTMPRNPALLHPPIKGSILNLVFIESYIARYENIFFISEYVNLLISALSDYQAPVNFNTDSRKLANN